MREDRVDAVDLDGLACAVPDPRWAARPGGTGRRSTCAACSVPGDRNSLQPVAGRLGLSGHNQLQNVMPARLGTTLRSEPGCEATC